MTSHARAMAFGDVDVSDADDHHKVHGSLDVSGFASGDTGVVVEQDFGETVDLFAMRVMYEFDARNATSPSLPWGQLNKDTVICQTTATDEYVNVREPGVYHWSRLTIHEGPRFENNTTDGVGFALMPLNYAIAEYLFDPLVHSIDTPIRREAGSSVGIFAAAQGPIVNAAPVAVNGELEVWTVSAEEAGGLGR